MAPFSQRLKHAVYVVGCFFPQCVLILNVPKSIGKVRFLGLPVAKNLIFPMLFQLFSFFCKKTIVFFHFFHFLQDLGRPAGRMLGYDDGCLPGRRAQILQKTKKVKKNGYDSIYPPPQFDLPPPQFDLPPPLHFGVFGR